jgi:hypothetical protein
MLPVRPPISHVKEFRLFADVINDGIDTRHGAVFSDNMTFTRHVGSDLVQDTCGMAGATKSSITVHFAIQTWPT